MPHVYIVTTGPGSKGTTSRRAVSYSRITVLLALVDPRELHRDARAIADVELQQHGGERLDRRGQRELAGIEGPHVRDLPYQFDRGVGGTAMVRADQHVALDWM